MTRIAIERDPVLHLDAWPVRYCPTCAGDRPHEGSTCRVCPPENIVRRTTPLRSRRDTGPDAATRRAVTRRDGYRCLLCGRLGSTRLHIHHRLLRGLGGSSHPEINAPSNLVSLCPDDHRWVHNHPREAGDLGLIVKRGEDPAAVPVNVVDVGAVYLTRDGNIVPVDDEAHWEWCAEGLATALPDEHGARDYECDYPEAGGV